VETAQFSRDGKTLVTADYDGGIYLWSITADSPTTLSGISGHGYSATLSPDGGVLATGYDTSGSTSLWNGTTDRFILAVKDPHSQGSQPAVFSPDGTILAAADINGFAYLWDTATHKLLATLGSGPQGARILFAAAFSPDGTVLATDDTNGGYVYLWDTATQKPLAAFGDQSDSPSSLAFLPNGKTLAVVEGESSTYLWDIATRSRVGVLTDPDSKGVYWSCSHP
jgi:WD40 repeat protein